MRDGVSEYDKTLERFSLPSSICLRIYFYCSLFFIHIFYDSIIVSFFYILFREEGVRRPTQRSGNQYCHDILLREWGEGGSDWRSFRYFQNFRTTPMTEKRRSFSRLRLRFDRIFNCFSKPPQPSPTQRDVRSLCYTRSWVTRRARFRRCWSSTHAAVSSFSEIDTNLNSHKTQAVFQRFSKLARIPPRTANTRQFDQSLTAY